MKIVINECYGGYRESRDFIEYYGIKHEVYGDGPASIRITEPVLRTDKRLIEYIEKFGGAKASARSSFLVVKEIPAGTKYYIDEYDGYESIITEEDIDWNIAED